MEKRSRLLEIGKTLLIVLLSLSALYLVMRSQLSSNLSRDDGGSWFSSLVSLFQPAEPEAPPQNSSLLELLLPVKIAVYQDQERYGLQYNPEEVSILFERMSTIFTDHLTSFGAPKAISEAMFQTELASTGIYLEFLSPLPVSALTLWLTNGLSSVDSDHLANQLVLSAGESETTVRLCYINAADGLFYAATAEGVTPERLSAILSGYHSNGTRFAFEDSAYAQMAPYTLIDSTTTAVGGYTVSQSSIDSATLQSDAFLSRFSFSSSSSSIYPGSGATVVRDGSDSLRIALSGVISYSGGEFSGRFPEANSLWAMLECVDSVLTETLADWRGDAQLYLSELTEGSDATTLTFAYSLNGALTELSNVPYAARFVFSEGHLSEFILYPRTVQSDGSLLPILPHLQAMAAMKALNVANRPLLLCYTDGADGSVSVGWVVSP